MKRPCRLFAQSAGLIRIAGLSTIQTQNDFKAFPVKNKRRKANDLPQMRNTEPQDGSDTRASAVFGRYVQVRDGRPDSEHISTSHVERSNLSMRMHLSRFTRLTNAYSKKLENLKAAVTLYFAWCNFVRVNQTLRVTLAMEAGLTDHARSLVELLGTA
jgi:hypothetical protein